MVMYGGFVIEEAGVKELYANPEHPYTLGLLNSLPRLDLHERRRLESIDGLPPVLLEKPNNCPFAPRCKYVVDKCLAENPPLLPVGPDHFAACWVNPETGSLRE
jgi:oligopeptide transport system ATP-binding protein